MLKRVFDVAGSFVGLLGLSPLIVAIALVIKVGSPGPVFFRGERVGRGGKPFRILKFRTMVVGACQTGPAITGSNDPRVTRIGRFLRRNKLDELPQLVNVLLGDMSVVGPRPEDPQYVALYTPEVRARILSVRPGITSYATLKYRNEEAMLPGSDWETVYRTKILPSKLAMDMDYLERATFWSDLGLIASTLLRIARPSFLQL